MEAFVTYRRALKGLPELSGSPTDMSIGDFGRFVDFLVANREPGFVMTGGEATLHPDFRELVGLARRKKLEPVVETSGVILPEIVDYLLQERVRISWLLHHPSLYDPAQRRSVLELARRFGGRELPLCVVVNASQESDDYQWVVEFLKQVPCHQIVLRSSPALGLAGKKAFVEWAAANLLGFLETGGQVVLDCGLQPCALSDEVYGRLVRHGLSLQTCSPRPGVNPALRLYHCREMVEFAGASVTSFRKAAQVQDYFYRRHNDLQWDYQFFPECPPCPSLRFARCQGPCMGVKARRLRDDVERLKTVVAEEGAFDPLFALGRALYELSRFAEAEQCLCEARRLDPSHGGVHLLLGRSLAQLSRLDEAEEEYRKAARLLPAGDGVLMEWSHVLAERGKGMRSRRVAEDARRLGEELRPTDGGAPES